MALLEEHKYLFSDPITGEFSPEIFREFLKADDMKNNMFIGRVYDFKDYQEFR